MTMQFIRTLSTLALWGSLAVALPTVKTANTQDAPSQQTFPFVLPWDDVSETITSVSALNPTPAGGAGFIAAKNGHFYDDNGRRIRFIGVNIVGDACFPTKSDAEKVAGRLHKFGINIVRFHHMDAGWNKNGIFDRTSKDNQHLSKDALDRLDYFIYQLKLHGVYSNLNLHVSRTFNEADGFPDTDKLADFDKGVDYFEPRMIELQKTYAHDLLTHANLYTKTNYTNEPAVAVVEINNENSLIDMAWNGLFDRLPPHYKSIAGGQWNGWLKQKYNDTATLQRAWASADKPYGPNLLLNSDFTRGAERWTLEVNAAPASARMTLSDSAELPTGVTGKVLRLNIAALGAESWHPQLHQTGIDLTESEPYTVTFRAKADRVRSLPIYTSIDRGDYHHVGLDATAELTTQWQQFTFAFTAARTVKDQNRLSFILGGALGTVDIANVVVRPGIEYPFPKGATLETSSVPLGRPTNDPAGQDWVGFLLDTERVYMKTMRDYLKKDLGVHANLVGSQTGWGGLGGLLREATQDVGDMHAYWDHPNFPHQAWDPEDWKIGNMPLVRDGLETLAALARYRLAGKPYTISEYNHPAPNEFREETIPLIAAVASLQDWDGFYLFDYNSEASYSGDKIRNYFSIDTDPAKMALLPAAALLFERQDMALANIENRLRIPAGSVPELMTKNGMDIKAQWEKAGIGSGDAFAQRFSVAFVPGKKQTPTAPVGSAPPAADFINKPDGRGPISWQGIGSDQAVFTADSPSSKIMVGYLGTRLVQTSGWEVRMSTTPHNFAALTLSAVDGKVMDQSRSLLLTAVGTVENAGMVWNKEHTSVGTKWGAGPTQAEGVPAAITIRTVMTAVTVYALDATGKRLGTVASKLGGGAVTFAIGPEYKTLWYEIEATIKK